MIDRELPRRRVLIGSASLVAAALAGCTSPAGDDAPTNTADGESDSESDESDSTDGDSSEGEDDDSDSSDDADSADDASDSSNDADSADDGTEDADEESETDVPEELPTDPADDDFVDATGQDVVDIETREGGDGEPSFAFDPPFVRVDEGATVRWTNTDGVFHTVTSTSSLDDRSGGGDEFDTQLSSEGDTFEWEAAEPGRQDYYCSPHAGFMFGSIDVV